MDLWEARILTKVTAKSSENLDRLKDKSFLATFVNQELVDPKVSPNWVKSNWEAG